MDKLEAYDHDIEVFEKMPPGEWKFESLRILEEAKERVLNQIQKCETKPSSQ